MSVRLRDGWVVGQGVHRSGWPYAMRSLRPLCAPGGILLEDFVERHFMYPRHSGRRSPAIEEPWVGIFHHGCSTPDRVRDFDRAQELLRFPEFRRSVPHLRLAVTLSRHLATFLAGRLPCPVAALKHPTEMPEVRFSPQAFLNNPDRTLVQVGWYLRNTRLIHQLPPQPGYRRARAGVTVASARRYDRDVVRYWEQRGGRCEYPGVIELRHLPDGEYDRLLTRNVVIAELFDASANNMVIECVVRNTPLIINRHPAVAEYLGEDYPLFYDRIEQIPELLGSERVLEGHEHLVRLDKRAFDGSYFRNALRDVLEAVLTTETGRQRIAA